MSGQCCPRSPTPGLVGANGSAAAGATAAGANETAASVGLPAVAVVVDQAQCFAGFAGLEVGPHRRLDVRDQQIPIQEQLDRLDGRGRFVRRRFCGHRNTPRGDDGTTVINAGRVITIRNRAPTRPAGAADIPADGPASRRPRGRGMAAATEEGSR